MKEEGKVNATFASHLSTSQCSSILFGLKYAPATFRSSLNNTSSGVWWNLCLVNIDDTVVFSTVEQKMVNKFDKVLPLFNRLELSQNLRNVIFFNRRLNILATCSRLVAKLLLKLFRI